MASSLVVFLLAVGLWSRHRGVLAGHGDSNYNGRQDSRNS